MRKYTLSKLINSLIRFEEELSKYLMERGFEELAKKSEERLSALRDSSQFIIVEMTLEPIYTVDISKILSEIQNVEDISRIEKLISDMYREIYKAMESVSMEFAELLKSFF